MTFLELANKIEQNRKTLWKSVIKPQFEKQGFSNYVIETITARLYEFGTDNENNKLKTDAAIFQKSRFNYSIDTVSQKIMNGKKYDNVTLQDSSDFYHSYKLEFHQFVFEITANFKKGKNNISDNFQDTYSQKEFENAVTGLTPKEIEEITINFINERITPDLYELL